MNTVKYYGKNLHGYIDLILIHDNNIINITETNCELKKYLLLGENMKKMEEE